MWKMTGALIGTNYQGTRQEFVIRFPQEFSSGVNEKANPAGCTEGGGLDLLLDFPQSHKKGTAGLG